MGKRTSAKPGELRAVWGRSDRWSQPDVVYSWGGEGADKPDGRMLMMAFEEAKLVSGKTLRQELEERGYDLTTLTFSIKRKK